MDACAHYFSVSFSLYPYPYPSMFLSLFIYLFPTSINNVISTPLLFNLVFMLWECLKNGLIRIMLLLNSAKWELDLISRLPLTQNSDQALHTATEIQTHTHYIFCSYLCFFPLFVLNALFFWRRKKFILCTLVMKPANCFISMDGFLFFSLFFGENIVIL